MGKIVSAAFLAELWGADEATVKAYFRGEDVSLPVTGGKIVDRRELAEIVDEAESTIDAWEQIPDFPTLQTSEGRRYDFAAVMEWRVQQGLALAREGLLPGDPRH